MKALATGMMRGISPDEIKEKIKIFLTPERTKTHGRPIYWEEAKGCNLKIEFIESKNKLWKLIYELYIRTNNFVSTRVSKCIESNYHSFFVAFREGKKDE